MNLTCHSLLATAVLDSATGRLAAMANRAIGSQLVALVAKEIFFVKIKLGLNLKNSEIY